MLDFRGEVKEVAPRELIVSNTVSHIADPFLIAYDMESRVDNSPFSYFYVKSVKSVDGRESLIDPLVLAKKQNIGVDIACSTILGTIRLCPCNTTTITSNKPVAPSFTLGSSCTAFERSSLK